MSWKDESGSFASTMWTVVEAVGGQDPQEREQAVNRLCHAYWLPLYTFLRRSGKNEHDAQDIIQGFFLKLLREDLLTKANRGKGRLRSFLITALRRYETDLYRREAAKKRGGDAIQVCIDRDGAEEYLLCHAAQSESPERLFDADWAHAVVVNSKTALAQDYASEGNAQLWDVLHPYLSEVVEDGYAAVSDQLGKSPDAVKMAVSRMRKRYRQSVRQAVAETLPEDGDVDEELDYLMSVAGQGG